MPQLLKVQNLFLSSDGFGAGEGQSLERPFGHANPAELASWAGATASWPNRTDPGGSRGLDDYFTRDFSHNIGAEIMGRNKFSPYRGPHDLEWQGWWGDEPPFRTPVFVMTHHPHPTIDFANGTSFRFVDGSPHEVLRQAQEAAGDRDVRIGGGPSTVRQFLQADLVDFMHLVVVPITLGRGVSLLERCSGVEDRFTIESVTSASGLVHQLWNREQPADPADTVQ